jgi:ParB family chromosome partitioning protein
MMDTARSILNGLNHNIEESMGVRTHDLRPVLSPVADSKYVGRRPLRNAGKVAISQVIPDPNQPRVEFSEESLDHLAQSIQHTGQLQAIRVRWSAELEKWVIIAGERRWRATKRAGLPEIDCTFIETELTAAEVLEEQIIENTHRENFKPVEQAKAFTKLMDLNKWTGKRLAAALRLPESTISRSLAILKLPADIQAGVESGTIPFRSAYELTKLGDVATVRRLAENVASGALTHEQTARAVRQRKGKPSKASQAKKLTFLTEAGWKVIVTGKKTGTYHDVEEALREALAEVRTRIDNHVGLY